jgi:hypothetical protein
LYSKSESLCSTVVSFGLHDMHVQKRTDALTVHEVNRVSARSSINTTKQLAASTCPLLQMSNLGALGAFSLQVVIRSIRVRTLLERTRPSIEKSGNFFSIAILGWVEDKRHPSKCVASCVAKGLCAVVTFVEVWVWCVYLFKT